MLVIDDRSKVRIIAVATHTLRATVFIMQIHYQLEGRITGGTFEAKTRNLQKYMRIAVKGKEEEKSRRQEVPCT